MRVLNTTLALAIGMAACGGDTGTRATPMPSPSASPVERSGIYRADDGSALLLARAGADNLRATDVRSGEVRDVSGRDIVGSSDGRLVLQWRGAARAMRPLGERSEEVKFASGDATIAGTFATPPGAGPFATVILAHHSGPETRLHDFYAPYQAFLLGEGYAVLAYDKRGTGASTGTYAADFERQIPISATDLVAAFDYVATRPDVDPQRIGVLGQSLSGWVVPLASERTTRLSFVALIGAPVISVPQQAYFAGHRALPEAELRAGLAAVTGGIDPRPSIRALKAPGLWIFATNDTQLPAAISRDTIAAIARETGKPLSAVVFDDADHFARSTKEPPSFSPRLFATLRAPTVAEATLGPLDM
jgi:dienelactone hydrolase